MKRTALIIAALLCMASRHPDRMIRSGIALNVSFNRGDATTRTMVAHTPTLAGNAVITAGTRFLALDGTGDYLYFADAASLDMTGDMTLSVWVRRNGNPAAGEIVAAKYTGAAGWIIGLTTGGVVYFDGRSAGGSYVTGPRSSASICNNAWRHVCAVRSGANWILYVDGESVGSSANGGHTFANARPLSFGAYDAGVGFAEPMNGSLDECRLYSIALAAAEVAAIYSSGRE